MRTATTILMLVALVACGTTTGSGPLAPDRQPDAAATSTSLGPVDATSATTTSPGDAPGSTAPSDHATSTTSTTIVPATQPVSTKVTLVAPYFYLDEAGHSGHTGPFLAPIAREVPQTVGMARAALEQLLAGPTDGERKSTPSVTTFIPEGVRLLGVTVDRGLAVVDLSEEFAATEDSASVSQRVAQVVFTLTRFDTVDRVLFREAGSPIAVPTGDGQLTKQPVGRSEFLEFAAAVTVDSPAYGGEGANPIRVTGIAAAFEATFHYALVDADGLILDEGWAMTDNGTGWGSFDFSIPYAVDHAQVGAVIVWIDSAEDGSRVDIREYPVMLVVGR